MHNIYTVIASSRAPVTIYTFFPPSHLQEKKKKYVQENPGAGRELEAILVSAEYLHHLQLLRFPPPSASSHGTREPHFQSKEENTTKFNKKHATRKNGRKER